MKKKILIIVGLFILVLGGVFFLLTRGNGPRAVKGMSVETGSYEEIISAIGYVEYEKELVVRAEVGGEVLKMNKGISDKVIEEEELLLIDDSDATETYKDLEEALALAEARLSDYLLSYNNTYVSVANQNKVYEEELESAVLSLTQLQEQIDQMTILVEEGLNAQGDLDALLDQQDILNQTLESIGVQQEALVYPAYITNELETAIQIAEANFAQQELEISKYHINSPMSGIMIETYVEEGEVIQAGQDLYKLADISKKYVVADIDESYIQSLVIGDEVSLSLPQNSNETIKGVINEIAPEIDLEAGTIEVKVEILENIDQFIQNMTVRVDFTAVSFDEAIVIPDEYILTEDELFVYMTNSDNQVEKQVIEVYNQNLPNVYVTKGLEAGNIILNPEDLEPGLEVQVNMQGDDDL